MVGDRWISVAGHNENPDCRLTRAKARCQLRSTHAGHDDVAKEKIDRLGASVEDVERLLSIGSGQNAVSVLLQNRASDFPNPLFVLDEQHGSAAH